MSFDIKPLAKSTLVHPMLGKYAELWTISDGVSSMATFVAQIEKDALRRYAQSETERNEFKGAVFEMYGEFLIYRAGLDPRIGLSEYRPNAWKFEPGIDGRGVGLNGNPATVQFKYHGPNARSFNYNEVSGFAEASWKPRSPNTPKVLMTDTENMVVFTTADKIGKSKVYLDHNGTRVLTGTILQKLLNSLPTFWADFRKILGHPNELPKSNVGQWVKKPDTWKQCAHYNYLNSTPYKELTDDEKERLIWVYQEQNRWPADNNLQNLHTPHWLCQYMLGKLQKYINLQEASIGTFNSEFLSSAVLDYSVPSAQMDMITDSQPKADYLKQQLEFAEAGTKKVAFSGRGFDPSDIGRQYKVVLINPPSQRRSKEMTGSGGDKNGNSLWPLFVRQALAICETDGFGVFILPASWRRPGHKDWDLWNFLVKENTVRYLEIHGDNDACEVFGKGAPRFDLVIVQKTPNTLAARTEVRDELGQFSTDVLSARGYLAHYDFDAGQDFLALLNTDRIDVRQSYSLDARRQSKVKTAEHCFPCVHSIAQDGEPCVLYAKKFLPMFQVSKVIITENLDFGIYKDMKGEYGLTQNCFAIVVDSEAHADLVMVALKTLRFRRYIESHKWECVRIDFRMLGLLKKHFWAACLNH